MTKLSCSGTKFSSTVNNRKSKPQPNTGPVTIVAPNTTKEKMEAILELCRAVHALARTLDSTNIVANVQNCVIDSGGGTGIHIGTDRS